MISKLSFDIIDTHDFKTLGIVDTSWYNPDISIDTPTIEIIPPGYTHSVSPFFMEKALNVYNSNGLGITKASCEEDLLDLPDGLWKVKYSICPNDKLFIERFFLKTDKIQCRYTQAFLNLDLSNLDETSQKRKKNFLEDIELYITGAIAASNNQNAKLASDLYKKADYMLDKYLSDNNLECGC
jgi:hypothetical protein